MVGHGLGAIAFGVVGLGYTLFLARQHPFFAGWPKRYGQIVSLGLVAVGVVYLILGTLAWL
jgi:hypothetical protein